MTDAARIRLAVAHVSSVPITDGKPRLIEIKKETWRTGGRASLMAWDWDAEDIDPQEDDGKMWVPVTLERLNVPANMKDINGLAAHKATERKRV